MVLPQLRLAHAVFLKEIEEVKDYPPRPDGRADMDAPRREGPQVETQDITYFLHLCYRTRGSIFCRAVASRVRVL
jgi:hypothetical protein